MSQQLKFYKGNETNLQNVSQPEAGAIYHCQDTGNTYLANENSELEIYSNTFTFSEAEADAAVPVNADTLNGKTADDFMTPIQVDDAINEAVENVAYVNNLSSDSSLVLADAESLGGLPAENYATKNYVLDAINQIEAQVAYLAMMTGNEDILEV